jgi:hypothetical protein
MYNGKGYSEAPEPAHDKVWACSAFQRHCFIRQRVQVFHVADQTYLFCMHPHGAIPMGGALFRPQLAAWPSISEKLRMGGASAVFALPIVRDFYLWFGTGEHVGRA